MNVKLTQSQAEAICDPCEWPYALETLGTEPVSYTYNDMCFWVVVSDGTRRVSVSCHAETEKARQILSEIGYPVGDFRRRLGYLKSIQPR